MQYHLKSSTCHALASCNEVKFLTLLILKINDLKKKRKIPSKLELAPHALGAKCWLDGLDWIPLSLL